MLESEQRVIAAARAVRESFLKAVETEDMNDFPDVFAVYRDELYRLITELDAIDREEKQSHEPIAPCNEAVQSDVCECGHKQWCHPNATHGECTYPKCGCTKFVPNQQKGSQ